MANRGINILLSLKDRFTKPLNQTTKQIKNQQRQIKQASNIINSYGSKANATFKSVAGTVGKVAAGFLTLGGVLSVAGLKAYGSESIELAKAQIEAETKLGAVLQNVKSIQAKGPEYYKEAKKQLMGVASELQGVGVIGDEVTLAGMQQLATFQLSEKEISKLSGGMLDLLAQQKGLNATQQDAVGIGNMIGKVMSGQTSALSRVGITFDEVQEKVLKTGNSEERAAMLAEILKQNVGGVNKALAETDQGKIQQMQNAYGDMREEIGKKLLPIQAKFASYFNTQIPALQKKILSLLDKVSPVIDKFVIKLQSMKPKINKIAGAIKKTGITAFSLLSRTVKWVTDNMEILTPIAIGLVTAFTAFNIISSVAKGFSVLTKIIKGVTAAQGALNFVMSLNPFGLVAAAIGVIVAAFIIAYKKSATFREYITGLWAKFKDFAKLIQNNVVTVLKELSQWLGENMAPKIKKIIEALKELWDKVLKPLALWLKPVFAVLFENAFAFISISISNAIKTIKTVLSGLTTALTGVIEFLTGIFTLNWEKVWSGLKNFFKGIFESISGIFSGIGGTFTNTFKAIFEPIYKKSETCRTFIDKLRGAFKTFATGLETEVFPKFQQLKQWFDEKIKPAIVQLKQVLNALWVNVLQPIALYLADVWVAQIAVAFYFVGDVLNTLAGVVMAVAENIIKYFSGIIDFLSGIFTGNWERALQGIKSIFSGIFGGIKGIAMGVINYVINGINAMTSGINTFSQKLGNIPGFGWAANLQIPQIPNFATGTSYFKGGLARINEGGRGEIVNLPNGSNVIPAGKSEKIINNSSKPSSIQVTVNVCGNIYGNDEAAEQIGDIVVKKIMTACSNI